MSDPTRGSGRTGLREDDGTADDRPEAAGPGRDGRRPRGGATAVSTTTAPATGTTTKAPATGTATKAPATGTTTKAPAADGPAAGRGSAPAEGPAAAQPERAVEQTRAVRSGGRPAATPATGVDGTQVITPNSPPSGVFAHPVSPLSPPAGSPAASPTAGGAGAPGAGAATSTSAPAASTRTQTPAGPDSTQAVPLAPAGGRPGRSTAGAPAAGTAGTGTTAETKERSGRVRGAGRGPRRARLQLRHIDTWSALKISLVVSIALFFVWMVAVGILFGVLNGLGVFQTLNDLFGQLSSVSGNDGGGNVITAGVVFGGAAVIGAINVVLLTALCTVGAVVYNLCSDLVGGLEVTLAERE